MKKIVISTLILLLTAGFFIGCNDDSEKPAGKIDIEFLTSQLNIDLNAADNPSITCVVNSEVGLKSVSMFILKTGNVEQQFKNTIPTFYNKNSFSIFEKPVYQEDMIGFKVVATDLSGNVKESVIPFVVKAMLNAPTITFIENQLTMREGDPVPSFTFTVNALSDLKYIVVTKVVNRTEITLTDSIKMFTDPLNYTFKSSDYPFISFGPGTTGIKVQAVDKYNKIKIALLPINFIELPAPTVTFNGANPLSVNEFSDGTIAGTISSGSGLKKVTFYFVGPNKSDTLQLDDRTISGSQTSYPFSVAFSHIASNTNGFMVKSQDMLNKVSKIILPISVNILYPAPAIVASPDNFNAIDNGAKISLSGQITSTVGLASLTINKINNFGESSIIQQYDVSGNSKSVSLSNSITATYDLTKIQIIAVDLNGKTTETDIKGTVGYYLIEKFQFGAEKSPLVAPGGFFSVPLRQAMTIDQAFTMQSNIDFSFYVTGNPAGILRICGMTSTDLSGSKYVNIMSGGVNVGVNGWTTKNATKIQKTVITDFDPAYFNSYTIDYIKSFAYTGSSIQDMTVSNVDQSTPGNFVIWFQTIDRGSGVKKGIIKYEGISPNSPSKTKDSNAVFLLSIKIEK